MPVLETIAAAVAARAIYDAGKEGFIKAFKYVQQKYPDLEKEAEIASAKGDQEELDRVFEKAIGVIITEVGNGYINIDGAVMSALNGIKFDHQHGEVIIGNTKLKSKVLITGGSVGATGKTFIGGNTTMESSGTKIEIGNGSSITMTGNASIKQT